MDFIKNYKIYIYFRNYAYIYFVPICGDENRIIRAIYPGGPIDE